MDLNIQCKALMYDGKEEWLECTKKLNIDSDVIDEGYDVEINLGDISVKLTTYQRQHLQSFLSTIDKQPKGEEA